MTATATARLPRYRRATKPPAMQLTDRDQQIVSWVYQLRFATQEQIQALLFKPTTASSCKRRLTLLYHNGYLDRRLIPLRSSFGANRAVYCLDKRGAELLRHLYRTGDSELNWRPADNDREHYFLEHTVGINDFRVQVTLAAAAQNLRIAWTEERELRSRALKQVVPDPRRDGRKLAVVPDGYFTLENSEVTEAFALELDRSTVEERPFKEKVRALGEWKLTGAYSRVFKTDKLRVLFVVASTHRDPSRLRRIKKWAEAEGGRGLFWFADLAELTPSTIVSAPVWQVAAREGLHSLLG